MAYEISWSSNAIEDYDRIISYLLGNWNIDIASRFIEQVERRLNILSSHPFIGTPSQKLPNVRSILLTKHNRMYYQVSENSIVIANIFDVRQDPEKNKY